MIHYIQLPRSFMDALGDYLDLHPEMETNRSAFIKLMTTLDVPLSSPERESQLEYDTTALYRCMLNQRNWFPLAVRVKAPIPHGVTTIHRLCVNITRLGLHDYFIQAMSPTV